MVGVRCEDQGVAVEWLAVSGLADLVPGVLLKNDKEVVRVKVMLQYEAIQKGHRRRREIDKSFLPFAEALGKRLVE